MTQNDIEQLLEQYGSDQRQQQHAAEHVRHMARRQARRRTALACVAVMMAIVGVVMHRWQQLPEPSGVFVAEQSTATVPHTTTMPPTITPNTTPDAVPATTPHTVEAHPYTTPSSDLSEYSEPAEPAVFSEPSEFSESPKNPENPTPSLPPLLPLSTSYNQDNPTQSPVNTPSRNRLHFTASVGASTLSGTSFGMKDNSINLTGIEPSTNYFSITPTNAYSANVGVAYTVASYSRSHLDVGISLSGYSQQGNLHIHDERQLYVNAMESNSFATDAYGMTNITNNTDEYYTFNTLSLYASVPLSLSLHPRGYNKAGWQLSLTPAHNLVATRHAGRLSAAALNPWKLTVGIGVALPNSTIRHISLTANLLPLYTSKSLHEFGIEFGI